MWFPFYRDLLGIISWNRSDKYLERRSVLVHIHGVCGLTPPFLVFISYTNPELKADKRLIFISLLCDKGVGVHVASALFSLTKGLNYWIMVKQGPKIQFNFYNIKTDTCGFHFTEIF